MEDSKELGPKRGAKVAGSGMCYSVTGVTLVTGRDCVTVLTGGVLPN